MHIHCLYGPHPGREKPAVYVVHPATSWFDCTKFDTYEEHCSPGVLIPHTTLQHLSSKDLPLYTNSLMTIISQNIGSHRNLVCYSVKTDIYWFVPYCTAWTACMYVPKPYNYRDAWEEMNGGSSICCPNAVPTKWTKAFVHDCVAFMHPKFGWTTGIVIQYYIQVI